MSEGSTNNRKSTGVLFVTRAQMEPRLETRPYTPTTMMCTKEFLVKKAYTRCDGKACVFNAVWRRYSTVRNVQVADQRRLLQSRPTRLQWQSSARQGRAGAPAGHSRNPRHATNSHTPVHCSCYQLAFPPAYSARTARQIGELSCPAPG